MTTKKQKENKARGSSEEGLRILANIEVVKGIYCNTAMIKHTQTEFIFDFAMAESGEGQLVSRIITNPIHAKKILNALKENIQKYEDRFGKIKID